MAFNCRGEIGITYIIVQNVVRKHVKFNHVTSCELSEVKQSLGESGVVSVLLLAVFCFLSIGYSVLGKGERRNVRDLVGERYAKQLLGEHALGCFTSLYTLKFNTFV
jgi:hypothetical protein